MSEEKKDILKNSGTLENEALEAATGGSFAPSDRAGSILHTAGAFAAAGSNLISGGLAGGKVIHSVCGAELASRQMDGTYYCPVCKREVPFSEIIKSAGPADTVARV